MMSIERRWPTAPGLVSDAIAVAAIAFVAYLLLGQRSVYGDGYVFLLRSEDGAYDHRNHPAYLYVAQGVRALGQALGLSHFESFRLCSQLGAAAGAGASCVAFGLAGVPRRPAIAAALLVSFTPAVLFYATMVEVAGPFLGCIGGVWLAAAWFARRPRWPILIALALATSTSSFFHASAVLLPVALVPFLLEGSRCGWPIVLALSGLHAGFTIVLRLWYQAFYTGPPGPHTLEFVQLHLGWALADPGAAAGTLWREWLVPFFPLSVVAVAVRWRAAGWFVLAVVAYCAATYCMLGSHPEWGAYLLPLAWPAAWRMARSWSERLLACVLALSLLAGVLFVAQHDAPERPAAFAAGVREVAGDGPVLLLIGGLDDIEARFVALPDTPYFFLPDVAMMSDRSSGLAAFDAAAERLRARGGTLLMTQDAFEVLHDEQAAAQGAGLRWFAEHLEQRYRLTPVKAGGFAGWEVRQP